MSVLPPRADILSACAADCDVICCYGGAKPTDLHLLSTVHCVDEKIFEWLKRREARKIPLKNRRQVYRNGLGQDDVTFLHNHEVGEQRSEGAECHAVDGADQEAMASE
jgi:hypothetical protein